MEHGAEPILLSARQKPTSRHDAIKPVTLFLPHVPPRLLPASRGLCVLNRVPAHEQCCCTGLDVRCMQGLLPRVLRKCARLHLAYGVSKVCGCSVLVEEHGSAVFLQHNQQVHVAVALLHCRL